VPLGTGRQATLLICLLIRAGEVVSRDELIDALWGESPPQTAANALQVLVHALRKELGQERIATVPPGYQLVTEAGEVDVARFARLVAQGRMELAEGNADGAAATLRDALALWRGPALPEVAYEEFAQGEIARLEELRLVALEERNDADLALARHVELVPELEALVAAHPTRERLVGQLMLALYRAGRQTDALAVFRNARGVLEEKLGLEPGPELRELQRAILRHDEHLRVEPPELRARRHLPAPQTALVGRRQELEDLGGLLRAPDVRLVTLTGPGGSGKTRLAIQAAHALADAFPDGVHFVDLSHLREPGLVSVAIAGALGVGERADTATADAVAAHLRPLRLLLLLDNFEVVDEAAPLLAELLGAAPGLALLVTSRTPLRLTAEHEYRVRPLPLDDAVQLFAARMRAVAPGFRRQSEEAEEVTELCRRLDCLPLALELAAARTREYSPGELLTALPGTLELGEGGARDLPARQRTLRATIGWSYDLLTREEQDAFSRLGVFAGGCTVDSALAVAGADRRTLAALVAQSLVQERPGHDGEPRYSLLETVREYAFELLGSNADEVERRHAEFFADLAEALRQEPDPGQNFWPRLDAEHDNLRAALAWCEDAGAAAIEIRLVHAVGNFWYMRGHLREGRVRLDRALRHGDEMSASVRAPMLVQGARLAMNLGDYPGMKAYAEQSLEVARGLGDQQAVAEALDVLGTAVSHEGGTARAREMHEEALGIYRELGVDRGLANSLGNLGYMALIDGDYERAIALSAESAELFGKIERPASMAIPLVNQGMAAFLDGQPEEALARFRQGLALARDSGYSGAMVYCVEGVAAVLAASGDAERAATLLGAAGAHAEAIGESLEPFEQGVRDRAVSAAAEALGEDAFALAVERGRGLEPAEAAALALEENPAPVKAS
jgi:predicted ATPase/DNA-binding SARP family transcriptional activator